MPARLIKNYELVGVCHVGKNSVWVAHVFTSAAQWAHQKMGSFGFTFWVVANQIEVKVETLKDVSFGLRAHVLIVSHLRAAF